MALLLLSAAAAARSAGGIVQHQARHAGMLLTTTKMTAPFASPASSSSSSSPPSPPSALGGVFQRQARATMVKTGASFASASSPPSPSPSPSPPSAPRALEKSLRGAYENDPAAATTAVLRGLPPQGRTALLEALRKQAEHEAQDLELGRRDALRFGNQKQQKQQQDEAATTSTAETTPPPPTTETATRTARAAAGAAAESAVVAEAAAQRAEAAALESADTVAALAASAEAAAAAAKPVRLPSVAQLAMVAASKGIPFLVFGMFDNGLMIMGGGALEEMIGARFGLSVLACSGLANTFADVFGLHISHVVEDKYKRTRWARLGVLALTPEQSALPAVRRAKWVGAAVGVATGCLIGLTPLLFMNQPAIVAAAGVGVASAVGEGGGG
jgi:hypothetical protein